MIVIVSPADAKSLIFIVWWQFFDNQIQNRNEILTEYLLLLT